MFIIFPIIADSFLVEKWGRNGQEGRSKKSY